jgi:hypothetical protein
MPAVLAGWLSSAGDLGRAAVYRGEPHEYSVNQSARIKFTHENQVIDISPPESPQWVAQA